MDPLPLKSGEEERASCLVHAELCQDDPAGAWASLKQAGLNQPHEKPHGAE